LFVVFCRVVVALLIVDVILTWRVKRRFEHVVSCCVDRFVEHIRLGIFIACFKILVFVFKVITLLIVNVLLNIEFNVASLYYVNFKSSFYFCHISCTFGQTLPRVDKSASLRVVFFYVAKSINAFVLLLLVVAKAVH
jgi:hypothetical protein